MARRDEAARQNQREVMFISGSWGERSGAGMPQSETALRPRGAQGREEKEKLCVAFLIARRPARRLTVRAFESLSSYPYCFRGRLVRSSISDSGRRHSVLRAYSEGGMASVKGLICTPLIGAPK